MIINIGDVVEDVGLNCPPNAKFTVIRYINYVDSTAAGVWRKSPEEALNAQNVPYSIEANRTYLSQLKTIERPKITNWRNKIENE